MDRKASLGIAVLALLLGACAAGNTHTFNYIPTEKSSVGNGRTVLVLPVDDQRPYILSGDEPATFVGEQRSGYGIPFNVTTSDKRPFTEVVRETVQRDLEAAGFRVSSAGEARRSLKIIMREFKSDTYNNINVDYDFEAIVSDASGQELARNRVSGEDELKGSFMNPPKAAKQKVPPFFYEKIHALVNDPKIIAALTN